MKQNNNTGCGYQGHEFGASYPDSVCIGGILYDADNCDDKGNLYEPMDYIPCPECNHEQWLEQQRDHIEEMGWIAKDNGNPPESCPFPGAATRYPKDGEWYRIQWMKGYDSNKPERGGAEL